MGIPVDLDYVPGSQRSELNRPNVTRLGIGVMEKERA